MGIDELLPEGTSKSKTSNTGKSDDSTQTEDLITIGSGPHQKKFTEEKLEEVKDVIENEFGMRPQEVLNNKPPKERFEILHDAATFSTKEKENQTSEYETEEKCVVCGNANAGDVVEIEGVKCCIQHPVARLAQEIDNGENNRSM
jgi:hypothetical protein